MNTYDDVNKDKYNKQKYYILVEEFNYLSYLHPLNNADQLKPNNLAGSFPKITQQMEVFGSLTTVLL